MLATLKIENLNPSIQKDTLESIISVLSCSQSIKIKHYNEANFAIVGFHDHHMAEQVKHALDGRNLHGQKLLVKWSQSIHIYVSNVTDDITSDILLNAFQEFHVCNVEILGHNKAILHFLCQEDAERAVQAMNETSILSSTIYCHWPSESHTTFSSTHSRRTSTNSDISISSMSYEELFAQAPLQNTSICIRNLSKKVIAQDIVPHLQQYGSVSDIHIAPDKKRAIVKLDTHASAATAILALQHTVIAGRQVQLTWAKQRHIEQVESHQQLAQPIHLFSSALLQPKQDVSQLLNTQHHHAMARPPAPAFGSDVHDGSDNNFHGWNQFDKNYYSASNLAI